MDFLFGQVDKAGTTFPTYGLPEKVGQHYLGQYYLASYGCGIPGEYILEPIICAEPSSQDVCTLPALEINVSVKVKLKGKKDPIVYNRVFLPEAKYVECSDVNLVNLYYAAKNKPVSPLQDGHRDLYDREIKMMFEMMYNFYPHLKR